VYRYSGLTLAEEQWHPLIRTLREQIQYEHGLFFNSALINYYRDGNDKMGWHSDDEPELGARPAVAILSLGETRDLQIRAQKQKISGGYAEDNIKQTNKILCTAKLTSGSLLIMKPGFQQTYQHQIPTRKNIHGGRISITFRNIIGQK
jgi:alkylated DNA repair dioxygenase AlkB